MICSSNDASGFSQVNRRHSDEVINQSTRLNLQGAQFYLLTHPEGLQKVLKIYERMETLCLRAMDTTISNSDRVIFNNEFTALVDRLEEITSTIYPALRLSGATLLFDDVKNIAFREIDFEAGKSTDGNHAVHAQTLHVHASSGTRSFRINSGGAVDIYRGWRGNKHIFSMGNAIRGPNYTQNDDDPGFPFASGVWATTGSAIETDDELVEVSFGSGKPVTYKFYPGASNSRANEIMHENQDTDNISGGSDIHISVWKLRPIWASSATGTFTHYSDDDGIIENPSVEITDDQRNALRGIPGWKTTRDLNNTDRSDSHKGTDSRDEAEFLGDLNKKFRDPVFEYYYNCLLYTSDAADE